MHFIDDRYTQFIQVIVARKTTKDLVIFEMLFFQDDQDHEQRMASNAVKYIFYKIELNQKLVLQN